eukprot:TRINITY_DN90973_c0_g1_i1.p1 TRINITY_DN90973_c0_g1~~TRINITY_DN90973_c0_g1_i1.p1  ORF type:complete len:328 (-),score=75.98 TRINITY_DN90973_c0_g1_i1:50-937(-)
MKLVVRTVDGASLEVDVDPELPLAVARTQVASGLGADDGEVRLIYKGLILSTEKDGQPLQSLGLAEGAYIVALVRKAAQRDTVAAAKPAPATDGAAPTEVPVVAGDEDLARQMQVDDDEGVARRLQEEMDRSLAQDEQAKQNNVNAAPRLCFVRGDFVSIQKQVPLLVDTGAQASILTSSVVESLGLSAAVDRRYAGVVGGVGSARVVGKLFGIEVRFGELSLHVDFQVLDSSQMPHKNICILGLDQLAVHHMVVDLDKNRLLIGGCEGYVVRLLDPHEIPPEFSMNPMQQCCIQ